MSATLVAPRPSPAAPASRSRDTFVDTVRTLAITIVVLEHWLFPVLSYAGGTLTTGTALAARGAWVVTWLGQVMPVVFVAGGAAHAMSLAKQPPGTSWHEWVPARLRRLAWPVLPLAATWLAAVPFLSALGMPAQPLGIAAHLVGQLLWFLAVYLVAVVAAPIMLRLHLRYGVRVVAVLAAASAAVDLLRFAGPAPTGYLNLIFVWLALHQLGFSYADGTLQRVRRCTLVRLGVGAALLTVLLVAAGPYPRSMVGLPGAPTSNMNPPTLCLLAFGVAQVLLVVAARRALVRLSARPRAAAALDWAVPRTMSIYLWHMPALVAVAAVAVLGLGMSTPAPGSPMWLLAAPLWLTALAVTLGAVLSRVAPWERPPSGAARRLPSGQASAALVLLGAGLLGLTVLGFGAGLWSVAATVAVMCGLALAGDVRRSADASAMLTW
jgi:hypothetical protein